MSKSILKMYHDINTINKPKNTHTVVLTKRYIIGAFCHDIGMTSWYCAANYRPHNYCTPDPWPCAPVEHHSSSSQWVLKNSGVYSPPVYKSFFSIHYRLFWSFFLISQRVLNSVSKTPLQWPHKFICNKAPVLGAVLPSVLNTNVVEDSLCFCFSQ